MPSIFCQRIFVPGCYYHVYNRGAHQQLLFKDTQDYQTFTDILSHYLKNPLGLAPSTKKRLAKNYKDPFFVKEIPAHILLAYCLMPNHFHLMIKQVSSEITISDLMRRLCVGYAMYYNERYHHSGTIFQGKYKNILIENEYQWIYLSKYIHRNPTHLQRTDLCKNLADYRYSSYPTYLGANALSWVDTATILARYHKNPSLEYKNFTEDGADVGDIERLTLDVEEDQFTKNGSL
jgi:REP element-mobilizing transposase RayT